MKKIDNNFANYVISKTRAAWYAFAEPLQLYIARASNKHNIASENPRVFIYTPTHNRGEILINRAVKSVLSQTYKNFIYVIIGDQCSDNTEQLVASINDERIKYVKLDQPKNRCPDDIKIKWLVGPVFAANKALELIQDEQWVARIDDDDIWVNDHIESTLKFALGGKYEFVTSGTKEVRFGVEQEQKPENLYGDYFRISNPKKKDNPLIGSINTSMYRSYLRFYKFNRDSWRKPWNRNNDLDLFVRMGVSGVRMGFMDKINHICLPRPGEQTIGSDALEDLKPIEKRK